MKKCLFLFSCFTFLSSYVFSQGCSDAGFCTMGAMKPDQPFNKKIPIRLRSMEVSFYRGTTPISPIIYVATLDASFSIIDSKTSLQVKLPYMATNGNFGSTSGISDISLCLTRGIYTTEKFDVNFSIGTKIPTNDSDKTSDKFSEEALPLPMYYQTSLGTFDGIAGISLITKKWLFATGVQIPFNKNNNQFAWQQWEEESTYPSPEYLQKNTNAIDLKRGTDVMVRVERNFRFSRLNFSLGLLPIWRITNDETTDYTTGERIKPEGAKGLALSAIATAGYNFNVKSGVKLLIGHKLVQRDVNPDGLTRELVSSVSYYYRF